MNEKTLLILLAVVGGGAAIYFMTRKPSQIQDQARNDIILSALASQQATANANMNKMMEIINSSEAVDPWDDPKTWAAMAQIGVQLTGSIGNLLNESKPMITEPVASGSGYDDFGNRI